MLYRAVTIPLMLLTHYSGLTYCNRHIKSLNSDYSRTDITFLSLGASLKEKIKFQLNAKYDKALDTETLRHDIKY